MRLLLEASPLYVVTKSDKQMYMCLIYSPHIANFIILQLHFNCHRSLNNYQFRTKNDVSMCIIEMTGSPLVVK